MIEEIKMKVEEPLPYEQRVANCSRVAINCLINANNAILALRDCVLSELNNESDVFEVTDEDLGFLGAIYSSYDSIERVQAFLRNVETTAQEEQEDERAV